MGKKTNTVLFMLIMTIISLVIMLTCFVLGFLLISFIGSKIPSLQESQSYITISILLLFVGATALSFFIYNKLVKFVVKKWNLEEKLYPFFSPKNRR